MRIAPSFSPLPCSGEPVPALALQQRLRSPICPPPPPLPATPSSPALAALRPLSLFFLGHSEYVARESYSSAALVQRATASNGSAIVFDDFRESFAWLRANTPRGARVLAWSDHGYQIQEYGGRAAVVDAGDSDRLARVGQAFAAPERQAHEIATELGATHVMVVFGGRTGYRGDDLQKFVHMLRIGGGGDGGGWIREADYKTKGGRFAVDGTAPPALYNSLLYKLSYHRFDTVATDREHGRGYDRARRMDVGGRLVDLELFEEVHTSANWLVRLYAVAPPPNLGGTGP